MLLYVKAFGPRLVVCGHCGEELPPTGPLDQRYCSRRCRNYVNNVAWRERERFIGPTPTAGDHTEIMCPLKWRTCVECGSEWCAPRASKARRCPSCGLIRNGSYYLRVTRPREGYGARAGTCPECGQAFVGHGRKFCSKRCSARVAHTQRRARERGARTGERVYRRRVFERDGFRCHLCGKAMSMDAVAPHPLSPSLDHVVPLSKGGTHTYDNCRAAHLLCNSLRGNHGPAQLAMV